MSNHADSLRSAVALYGEPLEAITVGKHYDRQFEDVSLPDENIILSPADGLKKLDIEYDSGFGGADCFPMYAWTASRVFFIAEYDGATHVAWIPRNPQAIEPQFDGEILEV